MKSALALIASFFGWGAFGAWVGEASPSVGFLLGVAVGAGVVLLSHRE